MLVALCPRRADRPETAARSDPVTSLKLSGRKHSAQRDHDIVALGWVALADADGNEFCVLTP